VHSGASLGHGPYGSLVAFHGHMLRPTLRPTIAGWPLPYLRVALILRRLEAEPRPGASGRRELSNVLRIGDAVRRAGWFN
jgi:hypothetical protein